MNKTVCLFTVVTAIAAVIYISLFLWYQQLYRDTRYGLLHANRALLHRNENIGQVTLPSRPNHTNAWGKSIGQVTLPSNVGSFRGNKSANGSSQKYIIYLCHRRPMCGGWSDRQRGIVSVYLLSVVTGRRFGLVMDNPCNITQFYVPNDVNWIIPAAELRNKTSLTINDMGSRAGLFSLLKTGDFNERYPQDVLYIYSNNGHVSDVLARNKRKAMNIPKWIKAGRSAVFAKVWKTLMRPSPFLQRRLEEFLQRMDYEQRTHPLVCCHVRIGNSDTFHDGKVRRNVSTIPVLWKFLEKYVQNGSKVFMATDNQRVRNSTRQRFNGSVFDTGGSIVHVDRWKGNVRDACVGFGYAVLDQLILTKCDVIVLTGSGYGSRAAWIRGGNQGLFLFVGTAVNPSKAG